MSLGSLPAGAAGSLRKQLQEGKGDETALEKRRGAGVLQGKDVAAKLLPKGK